MNSPERTGIFKRADLLELLRDKYVIFLGDSLQRSIYKDFVVLSRDNRYMSPAELLSKGEDSFSGDTLVKRSELTNGTNYKEVREYKNDNVHYKFFFLTRIYNGYVESILREIKDPNTADPDVLIVNSCLWDICRYGQDSLEVYEKNLKKFCNKLFETLPGKCLVIWRTTLPVSEALKGGFMTPDAEWCRSSIQEKVRIANDFTSSILSDYRVDVLDMHTHFRTQLHRQSGDGVHWDKSACRRMTNLLLTHIATTGKRDLPPSSWTDDSNECSTDEARSTPTSSSTSSLENEQNAFHPTPVSHHRQRFVPRRARSAGELNYGEPHYQQGPPDYYENWEYPEQPQWEGIQLPTEPHPQYNGDHWNYAADPSACWNSPMYGPMRHHRNLARREMMYREPMAPEPFRPYRTFPHRQRFSAYARYKPYYGYS